MRTPKTRTAATAIGPTDRESLAIIAAIRPSFASVAAEYDTGKYPADVYKRVRAAFRATTMVSAKTMRDALLWKYGHLGKARIPPAHERLISEYQRKWPRVAPELPQSPEPAFAFLQARLGGPTRYITVAFLVHLLFQKRIPIIDQFNFWAVNALLGAVRPTWRHKAKPSRYADIQLVASFMKSVVAAWTKVDPATAPNLRELDKFLMMYGKRIKREA